MPRTHAGTAASSSIPGTTATESGPGHGRFRFPAERVVKWNCVFRVRDPEGIRPGDYRYRTFVVVGTLEDVRRVLGNLGKEFRRS